MKLKPGDKLVRIEGEFSRGVRLAHTRAVVDNHVVYRAWSKRKQYWMYHIDHISSFETLVEMGVMRVISTRKKAIKEKK